MMKSFEIYLLEKNFCESYNYKISDLYFESDHQINEVVPLVAGYLAAKGAYDLTKSAVKVPYNLAKGIVKAPIVAAKATANTVNFIDNLIDKLTKKSGSIEQELKDKDKKTIIITFLKKAVRKLGILVVLGALIYIGFKTGTITQLLGWTGSILVKAISWISQQAFSVISGWISAAYAKFYAFISGIVKEIVIGILGAGKTAGDFINDKIQDTAESVGEYLKDIFGHHTGGGQDFLFPNPQETDAFGNPRTVLTPRETPKIDWDSIKDTIGPDKKKIDIDSFINKK